MKVKQSLVVVAVSLLVWQAALAAEGDSDQKVTKKVTETEVEDALADNHESHPYVHSRNRRTIGAFFDMFKNMMSNMFGGGGHKKRPRRPSSGYGAPKPNSGYGAPKPTSGYGAPPARPTSGYGAPKPTSGYGAPARPSGGYGAPRPPRPPPKRPPPRPSYGRPAPRPPPRAPARPRPPPPQPTYGRPTPARPQPVYGQPSNPQPTYGQPQPPAPARPAQPTYNQPQPSPQPTYGQPSNPQPTYGQPSIPQPTYGQPSQPSYGQPQPPAQPSYGNSPSSAPSPSSLGDSVFTVLPAPNLATGKPPAGFDAQATYGGTADFSTSGSQAGSQYSSPQAPAGAGDSYGSPQAPAIGGTGSAGDSYGSPQAPAIGGGGGSAGDSYGSPQAPAIGAGDSYGSPQAPAISGAPASAPAPAPDTYGSPQAQTLSAPAPVQGSYGSPPAPATSVNPFLSGYGRPSAAPLPITSTNNNVVVGSGQAPAPAAQAVIDSYGISPVSSSSNTLPSASSPDSYGSPEAAPVAPSPPQPAPDSYGSPQATPIAQPAPAPDSYGSPRAAAQSSQDSYGSPQAGTPTSPGSTVAASPQSSYVSTDSRAQPLTGNDLLLSTQAPLSTPSSLLSNTVNNVDVFGSALAPVVPSEPVPEDVAASLARSQTSFDAYVAPRGNDDAREAPVGELVSTEVEEEQRSGQLQRLDKSLDTNSIEEDYDDEAKPLFDNLRDVAFTGFNNNEPIEIDLTSGNVDLSNGVSDSGVTVAEVDLTGTTPKPVATTTTEPTTTTAEAAPEAGSGNTDDYYEDYSGDYDYEDEDDDYDPAEYGASIATVTDPPGPPGSIIDLIDFDSYDDDYEDEEREGKRIHDKDPEKMTVNDVLEYVDDMMKDVPLDEDEYYDYLEKSLTTTRRPKTGRKIRPFSKGRGRTAQPKLDVVDETEEPPVTTILPDLDDLDYNEVETTEKPQFISVPLKIEEVEGIGEDGRTNAGGGPGDPTVILAGTIPEGEESSPFSFAVARPGRQAVLALPASSVIATSNNAKTSPSFGTFLTRIGSRKRPERSFAGKSGQSSGSSSVRTGSSSVRTGSSSGLNKDWSQRTRERQRRRVWKQFNLNKRLGDDDHSTSSSNRQDIYHLN